MIEHKLASDRAITGLLPALLTLVSIAFVWALFGREAAFRWTFLAFCAFTALAAVAWWRTRSRGYLASTLYLLAASLMIAVRVGVIPGDREIAPATCFACWSTTVTSRPRRRLRG